MKNAVMAVALANCLLLVIGAASADQISGSLGLGGLFNPINATGEVTTLDQATGIDYVGDTAYVKSATGDFAAFVDPNVDSAIMQDFQFNPLYPNPVSLWSVGGFTFEMTAVTIITQDADSLSLSGVGTVFGNDFDLSPGTWNFNALGTENAAFTWSNAVRVVPLPAAGWMFISALIGVGVIGRRRRLADNSA